ncbi:hypothetical protein [Streptomyces narbonensis]|uniref:hypothetical protein n=1 Tax=Streptomyces narbonensis TaxID=67333 RepID=UPI0034086A6E
MLTYDNVHHAPLAKMKAAADDWSAMKGKLDKLAADARTTMAAKARDDYWRGVNAEVTKPFVDKTAKEFEDAAQAADGIHKILEDGYNAFKKAKDDLRTIAETEVPAKGFKVNADGTVSAARSRRRSQRSATGRCRPWRWVRSRRCWAGRSSTRGVPGWNGPSRA